MMNKHMREHSRRLSIKTTRLASLTAVFCLKRQPRLPTTGRSHPPTTEANEADDCKRPDSPVGGSEVIPEEQTLQPNDSGADDSNGSDGGEVNEEMFLDLDSDEFKSDEEDIGCDATGDGRGLLEFELRAAEAGKVCRKCQILHEMLIESSNL